MQTIARSALLFPRRAALLAALAVLLPAAPVRAEETDDRGGAASRTLPAPPVRAEDATPPTAADRARALERALALEAHYVRLAAHVESLTVAVYAQARNPFGGRAGRGRAAPAPAAPPAPAPGGRERFPAPDEGGSGVVVDPAGWVLTNHHVVADAARVWVGIPGRGKFWATVQGIDAGGDLALLRLRAPAGTAFDAAPLGDSDQVRVGQTVITSGNPFMLSLDQRPTVTFGIVSGVHRYQGGDAGEAVYGDALQIDAPINPGNSGGPLWNMRGELIGINGRISLRDFRERWNIGVGFAIPVNQVKLYLPALKEGRELRHGYLGVTFNPSEETAGGVRITEVTAGSPAAQAGLAPGDVIVRLNDQPVTSVDRLRGLISTLPEGFALRLQVRRGAALLEKTAVLVSREF